MKIEKGKLYLIKHVDVIKKAVKDFYCNEEHVSNKIAVHCPTREDLYYVQQLFGDVNHNRPLVFINEPYGCKHDGYGYKLITIEELKQFYKMEEEQKEPKYFAISKDEWNEYQELKNKKKEVDFSRLKTGSVVKLKIKRDCNLTAGTSRNYFKDNKYTIVLLNSNIQVSNKGVYDAKSNHFTTLVDNDGNFIHVIEFNQEHVEEVISY